MIKHILAAGTIGLAFSGAALAADLPLRTAPPAFVAPLPIFTWTGFYAGVNAGYVFDGDSRFRTTGNTAFNVANVNSGARPFSVRTSDDGFTAGGQIGYNYQFGAGNGIVVGVEADAAYTDLGRTAVVLGATGLTNSYRTGLDYLGTVRGRVGYAFNQFLVYGTGGFAYGNVNSRVNFYDGVGNLAYSGGQDNIKTGYAYGGGIEYALPTNTFLNFFHSSAVTIKAEYLHYDLGNNPILVASTGGVGSYTTRIKTEGDLARIGINYKF